MSMKTLINELKDNGEDFEFYPTPKDVMHKIASDANRMLSKIEPVNPEQVTILDPCCGDGRAVAALTEALSYKSSDWGSFRYNAEIKTLGIECSAILHNRVRNGDLPVKVNLIGTDAFQTELALTGADVVLVNPPYSEAVAWMGHILTHVTNGVVYFVVPQGKWQHVVDAHAATFDHETIHTFDFREAERAARVTVDVVRMVCTKKRDEMISDSFGFQWPDDNEQSVDDLGMQADEEKVMQYAIDTGRPLTEALEHGYIQRQQSVSSAFHAIADIDGRVFRALGITRSEIVGQFIKEQKRLRRDYWRRFLDHFEPVSKRIISKYREDWAERMMLESAPFTVANMEMIAGNIIEDVIDIRDKQVAWMFDELTGDKGWKTYKSTARMMDGDMRAMRSFRYEAKERGWCWHLDYRIVAGFFNSQACAYKSVVGWDTERKFNDFNTVIRSLGYKVEPFVVDNRDIRLRTWEQVWGKTPDDEDVMLYEFKVFKNGSVHMRFDVDVMRKINVIASRYKGWVHTPAEYAEETGDKNPEVVKLFGPEMDYSLFGGVKQNLLGVDK